MRLSINLLFSLFAGCLFVPTACWGSEALAGNDDEVAVVEKEVAEETATVDPKVLQRVTYDIKYLSLIHI